MNIRKINYKNDYLDICKWWREHDWQVVPKDCLPETGYIVEYNNNKICAGFLYKTDSKISWLEYIISNKNTDKYIRNMCLDNLIKRYNKYDLGDYNV